MKPYQGERAIISLTSWKDRISTVGLTIFSLMKQCPGFHIVLVLSEDEFPTKELELPMDIKVLAAREKIELLWCRENLKSLKKVLYTMDKYKDVPIISADDDCLYVCNYAQELYDLWQRNPNKVCTVNAQQPKHTNGTATLYFPHCFGDDVLSELRSNTHLDTYMHADDAYYEVLRDRYKCEIAYLPPHKIWVTHNDTEPLHNFYGRPGFIDNMRSTIQYEDVGGHDLGL